MTDPLGRRALFSPPAREDARPALRTGTRGGKESLYSASTASRTYGTVVVECSSCGARSRLGLFEFASRHLPFWLWVPWLRYSNMMACPACERRTWVGVSWLA